MKSPNSDAYPRSVYQLRLCLSADGIGRPTSTVVFHSLAHRKERNVTLTIAESGRALRLERISAMADRVFGNHEKAQRWLRKPSRVLNQVPIDLLQSEAGATLVEDELNHIAYGIVA
ncbi:MAG: DUF2384 domain-containing protein [Mesorhizobium sp.]|uniref:MbcA/ParS/Xre antitoxin family protein n=1 Tax=Mesorhizobium sp. TaxID=1871066 RepID=UPI001219717A|nr:MAG: DUF2384 domain-containing protein [Mesorhizobium sp.]TIM40221.1 MAG: DUF2384 domain-containing protein [Mesorhizobium sp.]